MGMTDNAANVAICNMALGLIGAKKITLGSTTEANYVHCATFFNDTRNELLECHPWNWCGKRAFMVETTKPLFGYDHAFTVPSDCRRVLTIADDPDVKWQREGNLVLTDEGDNPSDYDDDGVEYLAGEYVLSDISGDDLTYLVDTAFTSSDETTDIASYCTSQGDKYEIVEVEYIYTVEDVSTYPQFLRFCLVYSLAIKLSTAVTEEASAKLALSLQQSYLGGPKNYGYLQMAKSVDAQEAGGTVVSTSTFLDARR
jgi:hypothetical protein